MPVTKSERKPQPVPPKKTDHIYSLNATDRLTGGSLAGAPISPKTAVRRLWCWGLFVSIFNLGECHV